MDNDALKPPQQDPVQIAVKADDQTQAGAFSNLARIWHSPEAFQIDFLVVHAQPPFARLQSRLILTPGHAKRLMHALQENLQRYEAAHGAILAQDPPLPGGYLQ